MKNYEPILKDAFRRIKKKHGNPSMPEPKIVSKKDFDSPIPTSFVDLQTKEIKILEDFIDDLEGKGMPAEHSIEACTEHEVLHHMFCPYDLPTRLRLFDATRTVVKNKDNVWQLVNLFEDVSLNTNAVDGGKTHIPELYNRMPRDSAGKVIAGLYQRLWGYDMNVGTLEKVDQAAVQDLALIPYLTKEHWQLSVKKFATIVEPLLERAAKEGNKGKPGENYTTGCGNKGMERHTDREKVRAVRELVNEMDKERFKGLINDLGDDISSALKEYIGDGTEKEDKKSIAEKLFGKKGGRGPGNPVNADVAYYMLKADGLSIDVAKKIVKNTGATYPLSNTNWEVDHPIEDINVFASFGKTAMPGITKSWVRAEGDGMFEGLDIPDLVIMLDSSISMDHPIHNDSNAVIGAGVAADTYLAKGKEVAVYNFSSAPQHLVVPFTRNRREVYNGLVHFIGGGTTPDMSILDKISKDRDKPDLLLISDMEIQNFDDVVGYAAKTANRFTVVKIGGYSDISNLKSKFGDKVSMHQVSSPADIPRIVVGSVEKGLFQ